MEATQYVPLTSCCVALLVALNSHFILLMILGVRNLGKAQLGGPSVSHGATAERGRARGFASKMVLLSRASGLRGLSLSTWHLIFKASP